MCSKENDVLEMKYHVCAVPFSLKLVHPWKCHIFVYNSYILLFLTHTITASRFFSVSRLLNLVQWIHWSALLAIKSSKHSLVYTWHKNKGDSERVNRCCSLAHNNSTRSQESFTVSQLAGVGNQRGYTTSEPESAAFHR